MQQAEPLRLDFWIGLPNELNSRVATIYAARSGEKPEPADFYRGMMTPGTLAQRTFTSPSGLQSVSAMNKPDFKRWYAEAGMTVDQYEKESSKWEKLLREMGKK